ncbi:MAG: hypothetical protein HC923_02685, partial [Myxococcales bacterium]|nr:hypothetical protein [Myxococcales bacterium]
MNMRTLWMPVVALAAWTCGPDFTPADEIDRLRVLGIRARVAATPEIAWPFVDEDTLIDALVTDDDLSDPSSFKYRWRLCPVAFGSEADFRCVFTEDQFEEFLRGLLLGVLPDGTDPNALTIDADFELGTDPAATFNLRDVFRSEALDALPPAVVRELLQEGLRFACEELQTQEFPDFVDRPECNGVFGVRIDVAVCEQSVPDDRCDRA